MRRSKLLLGTLLALFSTAACAQAASLTVSAPDTAISSPTTVTVTGVADATSYLAVNSVPSGTTCPTSASAYVSDSSTVAYGSEAVTGSFSKTYPHSVSTSGTRRLCAYLTASTYGSVALVSATSTYAVNPLAGTVSLSPAAGPRENADFDVTVTGTVNAAQSLSLWALTEPKDTCPQTPSVYGKSTQIGGGFLTNDVKVGPGSYSHVFKVNRPEPGPVRLCGYLGSDGFGYSNALASGTHLVDVAAAQVRLAVTIDRLPADDGTRSATVSGFADSQRELIVMTGTTSEVTGLVDCSGLSEADPVPVGPGEFSHKITRAASRGEWTVCAQIADSDYTGPVASAGAIAAFGKTGDAWLPAVAATLPILGTPADDGTITAKRPAFAWSAQEYTEDNLVLASTDGAGVYVARSDGLYRYRRDDPEAGTSFGSLQELDLPVGVTTTATGQRRMTLPSTFPPGTYVWHVERRSGIGPVVASGQRTVTLLGPELSTLRVATRRENGRTRRNPGRTRIRIQTTPFSDVTVELKRGGHSRKLHYNWSTESNGELSVDWTCLVRGSDHWDYVVTSRDARGNKLVKRGRFKTVSGYRCAQLRAIDQRRAQREAAQERAAREAAKRWAAADRRRKANNCHAMNGSLRHLTFRDGSRALVCVAPDGSLLPYNF